jgi:hypothetical protein
MATDFSNKAGILADLWINYRDEEQFADFIEYNDVGLPLAYFVSTELARVEDQGKMYIEETFNLLCAALGLDMEVEYTSLNEMFDKGSDKG